MGQEYASACSGRHSGGQQSSPTSKRTRRRGQQVPTYLREDLPKGKWIFRPTAKMHLLTANETLPRLEEFKTPRIRRRAKSKAARKRIRGKKQGAKRSHDPQIERMSQTAKRPQFAWDSREETVRQILGLRHNSRPATVTGENLSTLDIAFRAQRIAQVAAGLGILSTKEADIAIRRHTLAVREDSIFPPAAGSNILEENGTHNTMYDPKGAKKGDRRSEPASCSSGLVVHDAVGLQSAMAAWAPRPPDHKRLSSRGVMKRVWLVDGAIARARRLVVHPPDLARLEVKVLHMRQERFRLEVEGRLDETREHRRQKAWLRTLALVLSLRRITHNSG